MNLEKRKIWQGWLAFLFIIIHFGFIIVYAFPEELGSGGLKKMATPYVEPVFTQKWSMFAPCPTINAHVFMKFYFEEDTTGWISPTADAAPRHSWYRGSYHGELVLGEANLGYWLGLDLDRMGVCIGDDFPQERIDEFQKGYSYFKIKNYLSGNARYLYGREVEKACIRFELEDVVTHEAGRLTLPPFFY